MWNATSSTYIPPSVSGEQHLHASLRCKLSNLWRHFLAWIVFQAVYQDDKQVQYRHSLLHRRASELKTFIEGFLWRVALYSRSAVSMPLGHVFKRSEELVISGKENSGMFSILRPRSKGILTTNTCFCNSNWPGDIHA